MRESIIEIINSNTKWETVNDLLINNKLKATNKLVEFMFPNEIQLINIELPSVYDKAISKNKNGHKFSKFLSPHKCSKFGTIIWRSIECYCCEEYDNSINVIKDSLKEDENEIYLLFNLAVFYLIKYEWIYCSSACTKCIETYNKNIKTNNPL